MYRYGSSYTSDLSGLFLLILIIAILYIVAWVFTMQIVTKAAREKGYGDITGKLWFIGLFGLIFTPAIIVAGLPDKRANAQEPGDIRDELPLI